MTDQLDHIRKQVAATVKEWTLAKAVNDIQVESDRDEHGEDFLRVAISWKPPEQDVDSELEALLERIEESVAAIDPRYPSVRFLDAA